MNIHALDTRLKKDQTVNSNMEMCRDKSNSNNTEGQRQIEQQHRDVY